MFKYFDELLCGINCKIVGCKKEEASGSALKLFLLALLACYVVYARGIYFPVFGIDNLTYFNGRGQADFALEVIAGRWGLTFINNIFNFPLVSPLLSQAFFIICLVFAMQLALVFWNRMRAEAILLPPLVVMSLFPYWAAQAYFAFYHIPYALCLVLALVSVMGCWQKTNALRMGLCVACVAAAASIYQASITFSLMLILCTVLAGLADFPDKASPGRLFIRAFRAGGIQLGGAALYLILHKAVLRYLNLDQAAQWYSVKIDISLSRALDNFWLVLPGNGLLLPPVCQILFWCLLVAALVALLWKSAGQRPLLPLLFLAVFGAAIASPVALSLFQHVPVPSRAMCGLALLWGAIGLLAMRTGAFRKIAVSLMIVMAIVFAARINYAWELQTLTTNADLDDAEQIWREINNLEEFSGSQKPVEIAFVGCLAENSRGWPQDMESIFGLSQFACLAGDDVLHPHALAAMRFVGADVKSVPPSPADRRLAASRRPWPATQSVFWNGDHVTVWLGQKDRKKVDIGPKLALLAGIMGIPGQPGQTVLTIPEDSFLRKMKKFPQPAGEMRKCQWNVENISEFEPGFSLVDGWVFNVGAKYVPQYVAFLNCRGEVVGLGATGLRRRDLLEKVAIDAEYAGFRGFALAGEKICGVSY